MTDYNVLLVSMDSLRVDCLGAYDESFSIDVETDNLDRFAERATVFDNHYAGSLPCMPARREWLTGTKEFLWRPWGPVEPFDETLPSAVNGYNTVSKLITDHYHLFEHGARGYHEDFKAYEQVRGHETDAWKTTPYDPDPVFLGRLKGDDDPHDGKKKNNTNYARNVADFEGEEDFFAPKVFSRTAEWLRENRAWDQWLCYVDSFDVHEPFHVPEPYASMYTDEDPTDPMLTFWPDYGPVDGGESDAAEGGGGPTESGDSALSEREQAFVRSQFAGKTTMVDRWFGRVLDTLDEQDLWDETVVIVTSDHGHYLGDHGWVGKPPAPLYDVLAHTPLLVWHPDGTHDGERVEAVTAAVDVYGTVLDAMGINDVPHRHSKSLVPYLTGETDSHRDWAVYGYWGSSVNVTDGTYTYHHPCDSSVDSYCYSAGMMNTVKWFEPPEPHPDAEPSSLPYTDSSVWQYAGPSHSRHDDPLLFDTEADPEQERNLADEHPEAVAEMQSLLTDAMASLDAPDWQYERLGLEP
jgi:arylsulfatase A-like enzyme